MTARRRWRTRWPALLLIALVGCKGAPPSCDVLAVSYAEGLYLEVWILGEENFAVVYRVNGQGHIGFGGGMDARNKMLSWVGEMTVAELERLDGLLERHGWYAGEVASTDDPRERVTRVNLRSKHGHRRFKVRGRSPDVEPIEALLARAARRRLDRELQMLPDPKKPSAEPDVG